MKISHAFQKCSKESIPKIRSKFKIIKLMPYVFKNYTVLEIISELNQFIKIKKKKLLIPV